MQLRRTACVGFRESGRGSAIDHRELRPMSGLVCYAFAACCANCRHPWALKVLELRVRFGALAKLWSIGAS